MRFDPSQTVTAIVAAKDIKRGDLIVTGTLKTSVLKTAVCDDGSIRIYTNTSENRMTPNIGVRVQRRVH